MCNSATFGVCGHHQWGVELCDLIKTIVRVILILLNAGLLFYFLFTNDFDKTGVLWVFYAVSQVVFLEMCWQAQLHTDKRIQPLLG